MLKVCRVNNLLTEYLLFPRDSHSVSVFFLASSLVLTSIRLYMYLIVVTWYFCFRHYLFSLWKWGFILLLLCTSTTYMLLSLYIITLIRLIMSIYIIQFSSVQSLSCVRLFMTPWIAAHQASLSITNSRSLLKLMSIESGDAIQPSHPLSSPSPPAPNPSQHQGLFQWVNSSHEVAKVLKFQLQHQSFQWTPRTDLL